VTPFASVMQLSPPEHSKRGLLLRPTAHPRAFQTDLVDREELRAPCTALPGSP
jgi:hypothetical protein